MKLLAPRAAPALIAHGSAALLLGALAFQHWGGLQPCVLCLWQRWPHVVAIALGLTGMYLVRQGNVGGRERRRAGLVTLVAGLALLVTAGIGVFHVGVEQQWWEGTAACGTTGPVGASAAALRDQLLAAPVVRCDEIAWKLFGISMAGWNALISAALALVGLKGGLGLVKP